MADPHPATTSFDTTLSAFGNNTGIVVSPEALEELDAGKRPPVDVEVNGHRFRSTVGVMSGKALISVSAAIRKESGLAAGDPISVTLTVNATPRDVDIPDELAAAFEANPGTETFFSSLSNSLQRYHVDNINAAKAADTRQRRVDKAIALFLDNRQR